MTEVQQAQHTPGPWETDYALGGYEGNDLDEPVIRIRPGLDKPAIAEVYIDTRPGYLAIDEANARLIAAAPDLLAALQRAVSQDGGLTCYCTDPAQWSCPKHQAERAIAKATGVQS